MNVPNTEIVLHHGGGELARFSLAPGEYTIGRSHDADLRAETPLLSRRHARLKVHSGEILLEDLGSSNGTFVNDAPIQQATRLLPDQAIRLGDVTLEITRPGAAADPGVSAPAPHPVMEHLLPDPRHAPKRYAIGEVVARGGMGAILDARQIAIDRTVAMKVMLSTDDESAVRRFVEEAKITGQLDHPNIVPIYELGADEQGGLFYTMKMVRGITLKKVIELLAARTEGTVKKYPLPVLLTVFQKVCDAVGFAHAKGVIHRDLKPENIMLGDFGSVLVMDWGLAKIVGGQGSAAGGGTARSSLTVSTSTDGGNLEGTMAGSIMGTPQYMSPEQARGEVDQLGAGSDVYALGTILFEILHLRPVVTGGTVVDIVEKVQRGEVEWTLPLSKLLRPQSDIPPSLVAVCRKALALDPAARYRRVEALQADLTAYQNGFITSAEQATRWKQTRLLIKRHKAASLGIAAVLAVGSTLGTGAIAEGRRAAHALAELKRSAPSMLALAQSEAGLQRFDSALEKAATALALDPSLLEAHWQRAWVLLGQQKWREAVVALRQARDRDSSRAHRAAILPVVENFAASPDEVGQDKIACQRVLRHLQEERANGPIVALATVMRMTREDRLKLIHSRVEQWLGAKSGAVVGEEGGGLQVILRGLPIDNIEPLRGLPIDGLNVCETRVSDLGPVRGMSLRRVDCSHTAVADLRPLEGMPLTHLNIDKTKVADLTPVRGAPLVDFSAYATHGLRNLSPLDGAPLERATLTETKVTNLLFLKDAPIRHLRVDATEITDISPLRGKPLTELFLGGLVRDLSPLIGCPIEHLSCNAGVPADLSPLLQVRTLKLLTTNSGTAWGNLVILRGHPSLSRIVIADQGKNYEIVEFWAEYDARQASEKK